MSESLTQDLQLRQIILRTNAKQQMEIQRIAADQIRIQEALDRCRCNKPLQSIYENSDVDDKRWIQFIKDAQKEPYRLSGEIGSDTGRLSPAEQAQIKMAEQRLNQLIDQRARMLERLAELHKRYRRCGCTTFNT